MLKRDALVVSPSYPRDYPFVISHAKGAEAWDVDGNRFLDFMAGIAVTATGHSHPKVVQAITEAAQKFVHISSDYWHENQIALGLHEIGADEEHVAAHEAGADLAQERVGARAIEVADVAAEKQQQARAVMGRQDLQGVVVLGGDGEDGERRILPEQILAGGAQKVA